VSRVQLTKPLQNVTHKNKETKTGLYYDMKPKEQHKFSHSVKPDDASAETNATSFTGWMLELDSSNFALPAGTVSQAREWEAPL
jgi:hypothetical protein